MAALPGITYAGSNCIQAFLTYDPPFDGVTPNALHIVLYARLLDLEDMPYIVLDNKQLWGINRTGSHLVRSSQNPDLLISFSPHSCGSMFELPSSAVKAQIFPSLMRGYLS